MSNSKQNRYCHDDDDDTFNLRYYNKELKKIIQDLDTILSESSSNDDSDSNSVKTVHYIRRNRRDKTDFIDIIVKEHRRVEKLVDSLLEETNYSTNKQKK